MPTTSHKKVVMNTAILEESCYVAASKFLRELTKTRKFDPETGQLIFKVYAIGFHRGIDLGIEFALEEVEKANER